MSNSIEQAGSLRPESSPTAAFSLWGVGWVLGISTTIHGAVLSGVLMWHELSQRCELEAASSPAARDSRRILQSRAFSILLIIAAIHAYRSDSRCRGSQKWSRD